MTRQIFVLAVLLVATLQVMPHVQGKALVNLYTDAICDALPVGGYLDLTDADCQPAGCEPVPDSTFRRTVSCPPSLPDDFSLNPNWPVVMINTAENCSGSLEFTANADQCSPAQLNGDQIWTTLTCGANGGVEVSICQDACKGTQCQTYLASDTCTVHLGGCPEYVAPPITPPVSEPVSQGPFGTPDPLVVPKAVTPSDLTPNAANYYAPQVVTVFAAVMALGVL